MITTSARLAPKTKIIDQRASIDVLGKDCAKTAIRGERVSESASMGQEVSLTSLHCLRYDFPRPTTVEGWAMTTGRGVETESFMGETEFWIGESVRDLLKFHVLNLYQIKNLFGTKTNTETVKIGIASKDSFSQPKIPFSLLFPTSQSSLRPLGQRLVALLPGLPRQSSDGGGITGCETRFVMVNVYHQTPLRGLARPTGIALNSI
eukprot:2693842-Rhodomonas_salina.1